MLLASPPQAYVPASPPFAPQFVEELERLVHEKEQALEEQEFERAARLRNRQRSLVAAAKRLEAVWKGEVEPAPPATASVAVPTAATRWLRLPFRRRLPRRVSTYGPLDVPPIVPLLLGWLMFGFALGIGILLGWLIWM